MNNMHELLKLASTMAAANDKPGISELCQNASNAICDLRKALEDLVDRYTTLVNSGDAGQCDPEQESCVIEARKILGREDLKLVLPKVQLNLVGLNGNAFVIMGAFSQAAVDKGWTKAQIYSVLEEAKSGNYDHLLQTIMKYTENEYNEE